MIVNFGKALLAQSIAKGIDDILLKSFPYGYEYAEYFFDNGSSEQLYSVFDHLISASFDFESVYIHFFVKDISIFSIVSFPVALTKIEVYGGYGDLLLSVEFDTNEFVIQNFSELSKLSHITARVTINV